MKAGKAWGETQPIFAKNNVEIHRIDVLPGGYCSKHRHQSKFNAFFVESGKMVIESWKASGTVDETHLGPGMMTAVAPGEFHRFRAVTACVVYEIYWSVLNPEDIEREDVGGLGDVRP